MGNATTFPIETLMFWVYGVALNYTTVTPHTNSRLIPYEFYTNKQVSVFGDDCIVPSYLAKPFIKLMGQLGSVINDDKSFYGVIPFRESCGGDYLRGFDVRPYKLTAPESEKKSNLGPWLHIILNRLLSKYISYFGPVQFIHNKAAIKYLVSVLVENKVRLYFVPDDFPEDAGVKMCYMRMLTSCYPDLLWDPVAVSEQGTVSFRYTRFVYSETQYTHEMIRYFTWLKNPVISNSPRVIITGTKNGYKKRFLDPLIEFKLDDVIETYTTKRKGGYQVARGIDCHWPSVKGLPF